MIIQVCHFTSKFARHCDIYYMFMLHLFVWLRGVYISYLIQKKKTLNVGGCVYKCKFKWHIHQENKYFLFNNKKIFLNQLTYNIFNANRHKYINNLFYKQNHMYTINMSTAFNHLLLYTYVLNCLSRKTVNVIGNQIINGIDYLIV